MATSVAQQRAQRLGHKNANRTSFEPTRTVEVLQDYLIDLRCSRDDVKGAAENLLHALRTNTNLVAAVHQVIAAYASFDRTYEATVNDVNSRLGRKIA